MRQPPNRYARRPESSHDYATRVQGRDEEFLTHPTLEDAQQAIEEAVGEGVTIGHTNIWKRSRDAYDFHSSVYIRPGTPVRDFPWT